MRKKNELKQEHGQTMHFFVCGGQHLLFDLIAKYRLPVNKLNVFS